MKKWLCLLLAVVLTRSLAACQRSQNMDTPSDVPDTTTLTSPTPIKKISFGTGFLGSKK